MKVDEEWDIYIEFSNYDLKWVEEDLLWYLENHI